MQTHQVPPTPPQPRIATTHELMMPFAADLVRQKAKGNSHGQMVSWLCGQGVYANLAEIASFWSYHALQKQKMAPSIGPIIGRNDQNSEAAPLLPGTPEWLLETDKNVQNLTAWFRDHAPADLGTLMHLYKSMLFNLLLKGDTSPEKFQQVQQMTRTVISYEQNQTRLELRRETLNRQKSEPEPNAGKLAKPPADQTAAAPISKQADELPAAVAANPTLADLSNILAAIVSRHSPKADGGSPPATADLSESCRDIAQRATAEASAKEEAPATPEACLMAGQEPPLRAFVPSCEKIGKATPAAKYPSGPTAAITAPAGNVPPIPSG